MFLLITPAHNEVDQVDGLLNCMQASTLQPDCWLIIDDNSTDGTGDRFRKSGSNLKFLKVYRMKQADKYMEFHISKVLQTGLYVLGDLLKQADYIGFLDADIRFGPNYWKRLVESLTINPHLGIVSGVLCSRNKHDILSIEPYQRLDTPRGGLRLIKGECYYEIGGVERSRAWD
ncbi:MAG: glycosyltransferase family 2 protein, partial [Candidatus Cloacimonetes bacterium]|nr:glycosyltransferase family 2 protein [Candidatus Cloacimonadota bacterium]